MSHLHSRRDTSFSRFNHRKGFPQNRDGRPGFKHLRESYKPPTVVSPQFGFLNNTAGQKLQLSRGQAIPNLFRILLCNTQKTNEELSHIIAQGPAALTPEANGVFLLKIYGWCDMTLRELLEAVRLQFLVQPGTGEDVLSRTTDPSIYHHHSPQSNVKEMDPQSSLVNALMGATGRLPDVLCGPNARMEFRIAYPAQHGQVQVMSTRPFRSALFVNDPNRFDFRNGSTLGMLRNGFRTTRSSENPTATDGSLLPLPRAFSGSGTQFIPGDLLILVPMDPNEELHDAEEGERKNPADEAAAEAFAGAEQI